MSAFRAWFDNFSLRSLLIIGISIGAAAAATVVVIVNDALHLERAREKAADAIRADIDVEFARAKRELHVMQNFYHASNFVDAEEFQTMSNDDFDAASADRRFIVKLGYLDLRREDAMSLVRTSDGATREMPQRSVDAPYVRRLLTEDAASGGGLHWGDIVGATAGDDAFLTMIAPVYETDEQRGDMAEGAQFRGMLFAVYSMRAFARVIADRHDAEILSMRSLGPRFETSLFESDAESEPGRIFDHASMGAGFRIAFALTPEIRQAGFFAIHKYFLAVTALALAFVLVLTHLIDRDRRRAIDARNAADEANYQKSRFLAMMSHEIRTPLNGILGMSDLVSKGELSNAQRGYIGTLNRSAQTLLSIINGILDLSKIEADKLSLDPTEINLAEIVEQCLVTANLAAAGKGVEVALDYPLAAPRRVVADGLRIQQVLINLLTNAVKFTAEGSVTLKVAFAPSAEPGGGEFTFVVEDTGIGIPEDKIEAIFQPFSQADISTTRNFGGTGLGLTIVREIAAIMGGSVFAESQDGAGSRFTAKLPVTGIAPRRPNRDLATIVNLNYLAIGADANPAAWECGAISAEGAAMIHVERLEEAEALPPDQRAAIDITLIDGAAAVEDGARIAALPGVKALIRSSRFASAPRDPDANSGFDALICRPILPEHLVVRLASLFRARLGEARLSSPPPPVKTPERSPEPAHRHHVLIVEDDPTNRMYCEAVLERLGCGSETATNGAEAVDALAAGRRFDLILMDCQMPVMDGFEATRRIAAMIAAGDLPPTPIVAVTANAVHGDRERCLEAGMDDFLSKPIREDQFADILARWRHAPPTEVVEDPAPSPNDASAALQVEPKHADDAVASTASPAAAPDAETAVIDETKHASAREMLGDRFGKLLELFLKDGARYADEIVQSVNDGAMSDCIRLSHTLKSTSNLVGASRVSNDAAEIERLAKADAPDIADLTTRAARLKQEYARAQQKIDGSLPAD